MGTFNDSSISPSPIESRRQSATTMASSSHPPGTLILEPQVVIATGGSGSNARSVTVKGAYQTSSAPNLPQYPIAYPGMCPPNAMLQQNTPSKRPSVSGLILNFELCLLSHAHLYFGIKRGKNIVILTINDVD